MQLATFSFKVMELAKVLLDQDYEYRGNTYNPKKLGYTLKFMQKKHSAGTHNRHKKLISLSKWIIDNSTEDICEWKNVILHEISHALDYEYRGTSDHSNKWKSVAIAVGARPESTSNIEINDSCSKYTIICDTCKQTHPAFKRRKTIEDGRQSCGNCSNVFDKRFVLRQIQNY